jgi:competence/damage-inducible protein CinA-like protein
MDLELVTIGTELVLGFTVDTNGAFIGQRLAEAGLRVVRRTSVGDAPEPIQGAVRDALARSRLVLTTGGLGPTRDDITKRVVAELFDAPLEFQPAIWDAVVARFARFGRVPSESNRCQAEVPRGAVVLPNRRGTAPGIWLSGPPGEVIMVPGVPGEMKGLLTEEIIPRLRERTGSRIIKSLVVRVTSVPESTLSDRLKPVEDALAPLTLAYLPGVDGVDLRLTAWDLTADEADRRLEAAARAIEAITAEFAYGRGDDNLAAVVLDLLKQRKLRLAVAESCTGGMLGERITEIPGSSAAFLGGIIAYDNSIKTELLDVDPSVFVTDGAVSEAAVKAMATAAIRRTGADIGISISGVAGPDGGTAEKPVGTVWVGFALGDRVDAQRVGFPGGRQEIRGRAAQFALHGLRRRLLASR